MTEWDEFKALDWDEVADAMARQRRSSTGATPWTPRASGAAGLTYEGIGR